MRSFRAFTAAFVVALQRLWAKKGLATASALGFVMAVALAYTLPLYADSVYQRILNRDINDTTGPSRIPPFWFDFRYDNWSNYAAADQFITTWAPRIIGLPLRSSVRYFQTGSFRVFSMQSLTSTQLTDPLFWSPIASIDHFADHVSLVSGQMADTVPVPASSVGSSDSPDIVRVKQLPEIKILVSRALADQMSLNVGDRLVLISKQDYRSAVKQPVYIAGIWMPRDRGDPYWINYQWDVLQRMVYIDPLSFVKLAPAMKSEIVRADWGMDFAGTDFHVRDVAEFLDRVNSLMKLVKSQQMPISLGYSPQDKLLAYQKQSDALTLELYAFSMPVFVLVFVFLILVAGLMANSQRNEIAVLRSRGATVLQVFGISLLEALILGVLSLALAVPVAMGCAVILGQTRSFLAFTGGAWLSVAPTPAILPGGILVAMAAVIVTVLPIIGAARHTIITYRLDQARLMTRPLWQRAAFDLLLLLPAAYWTYLLHKQGIVDLPGIGASGTDPYGNPAMFLVPSLAMLALSLLFIRIVPLLMRVLTLLLSRLRGVSLLLALRQLERSPGLYVIPMFLLMLTLALASFTASIASTLDNDLVAQTRYGLGSDVLLKQTGEDQGAVTPATADAGNGGGSNSSSTTSLSIGNIGVRVGDSSGVSASSAAVPPASYAPIYEFLPISQYLQVPHVQAAARAGRYAATLRLGGVDVQGHVLGIDRLDFPAVAYWHDSFAAQSLGALMNELASRPEAVLIPTSMMKQYGLGIGDRLPLSVFFPGETLQTRFVVAGSFDLWPTWYPKNPDDGPLLVGNLDYIFQEAQGQFPYDVWIKVRSGADMTSIVPQVRALGQRGYADNVTSTINEQLNRPERQGLFGVLTIGFIAAALFTALGFALYAVFSFRQRYIEMGVLRAIGLSVPQMVAFVGWELVLVLVCGAAGGTLLGVAASRIYIPFLQTVNASRAMPFEVIINWPEIGVIYMLFGALFAAVLVVLSFYLRRLRIFQAVKLGESL